MILCWEEITINHLSTKLDTMYHGGREETGTRSRKRGERLRSQRFCIALNSIRVAKIGEHISLTALNIYCIYMYFSHNISFYSLVC